MIAQAGPWAQYPHSRQTVRPVSRKVATPAVGAAEVPLKRVWPVLNEVDYRLLV